jgi:DNA-binding PadR family transcriptional regulator
VSRHPNADELRSLALGILARREMYGYEVAAHLALTDEAKGLPAGSVYPALRSLERAGLALGRWVEVGPDVPRRRYYALTPAGQSVASKEAGLRSNKLSSSPRAARP